MASRRSEQGDDDGLNKAGGWEVNEQGVDEGVNKADEVGDERAGGRRWREQSGQIRAERAKWKRAVWSRSNRADESDVSTVVELAVPCWTVWKRSSLGPS